MATTLKQLPFICLWLIFTVRLAAQDYIIQVQHYGLEEGLSHPNVQAVHQDERGFIWLGTMYGLNRFDGYEFKWYTREKNGLQSNAINHILEDDGGWMWLFHTASSVRQDPLSIDLFHPATEEVLSFEEKFGDSLPFKWEDITSFTASPQGQLAFVLGENQLALYSHQTGFDIHPVNLSHFTVSCFSNHQTLWGHSEKNENELRDVIVEADLTGTVLNRYEHDFPYQYNFVAGVDREDNFWYLIKHWENDRFAEKSKGVLFRIDSNGQEQPYPLADTRLPANAIDLDIPTYGTAYGVWVNPESHLFWLYGHGSFQGFHPASGWYRELAPAHQELTQPNDLLFGNSGKTWVGTPFGLTVIELNPNPFQSLAHDKSKENALGFRGITEDEQGTIWAGIDRGIGWLGRFKKKNGVFSSEILERDKVAWGRGYRYGIFSDSRGLLWFSTGSDSTITKLNPVDSSFQRLRFFVPGKDQTHIWSFFEDENGVIWFGTDNGGVGFITKEDSVILLPEMPAVIRRGGCIYDFHPDATGKVWVATDDGLYQLDPDEKRISPFHPSGLPLLQEGIYHLHEDKDGSIWLGTNGAGLIHWSANKDTYQRFTKADGLSDNTIYAVYDDDFENLWLPSNYGIIRFHKKTHQSKAYLGKDGIAELEFNRTSHFQSKDGTLFFGGINGITAFHPRDLVGDSLLIAAPLKITAFQQFDGDANTLVDRTTSLRQTHVITLRPEDRFFRLEFALLNYSDVKNIQYGYMIEGIDEDWSFQKENSIRFSRLPYGQYLLRVKGQSSNGQWSENELAIQVNVLKPYYLQSWFLVLCAAILLISGLVFYKMRTAQLKRQKARLEAEVARQTEEIRQQADELKSLERLKSRFFANVSHELRTPLSLMIGPLDSLLKKESDRPQKEQKLLEFVRNNSRHLLKLVNEILDLSKLERGRLEVKKEAVHLREFLRPLLAQFSSFSDSEGVKLGFDYLADPGLFVLLDKDKFEKIIHNFLSNAIKFSPPGGRVRLVVEEQDEWLIASVTDEGPGIHPDDLPHIFDRFYQSKQPDAPVQGGTGIGLSLAFELAGLLGGRIWAESPGPNGKGSVFYFQFPKKEVKAESTGATEDAIDLTEDLSETPAIAQPRAALAVEKERPAFEAQKATLLIVEDNSELRSYLEVMLEDEYQVITAENGKVAWEWLTVDPDIHRERQTEEGEIRSPSTVRRPPDLIISDLMMPVMDGFQLLEKIKGHDGLRHLPVIMLTARADVRVKLRALRIGVDDYLTKPFVEEELKVRIHNLLKYARARMELFAEGENETGKPEKEDKPVFAETDALWLEEVENLFSETLDEPQFKIDWIASQLHLSQRQFNRRLKKLTGFTPNQYLREMRLNIAKDFLLAGKYATVKETSFAVGFQDTSYFSERFQERFGVNPSEYLL